MPIDRVDTLLEALEESQLLTAAQLQECRSAQGNFADTKALARHLLQRDWLTPYQVNHLLQGKAGELFLDNYVLMERIGQGGMGQVFRAKHRIMNRVVALKIIRQERLANPEMVKRFRREIQLAGQLAHPNIVIAYDAAQQHGTHFLVMEFVEGIDLARFVEKNGRRPVAQASEWVRQVALGLQHAHERGMVHRDIKPANLLFAVKENVVKVLDMGLARLSQGADLEQTGAGLTQEGTVMGTPDYMAPEQAEESTGVDIRADIYSLGCTLYFLLAGHAPFPGGTLAQKLRKHAQAEPEPLERQRDDVPPGLSAIVRKIMAKRPEDRYQTPGDVAVWNLAEGSVTPLALTVLDPANAVTYGTFVGDDRVATCTGSKVRLWVPNGRGGLQDLDPIPPQATATGLAWLPAVPRENAAGAKTDNGLLFVMDGTLHVWNLDRKKEWRPPLGHTQPARGLTFLGDGDRLVSSGDDRTVRFWDLDALYDAATGWPRESRPTLSAPGTRSYAFLGAPVAADGKLVLTLVNSEKFVTVWVWENSKWNPIRNLEWKDAGGSDSLTAVALSEDGTRALTAGSDKVLRLWDVKRAVELKKIEGLPNLCSVVRLLPEGRAYTWDGTELRLWEGLGDTGKPSFVAVPVRGSAVTVSPGREMAIVGAGDGHLERLTELARGKPLRLTLDWWQKGTISALSLSPDRKAFLAGSGGDGPTGPRVGLWDLIGDPIAKPQLWDLRGAPTGLTFAPDGRHAALANPDGTIYILRLPAGK